MLGSDRRQTHIRAGSASRARKISAWVVAGAVALTLVTLPTLEPLARAGVHAPNANEASASAIALIENRRVISYPMDQVWPTAIRYLRVDRGFGIDDHDREAGYIMFDFNLPDQRKGSGSLEVFETTDSSGRPSVSLAVSTDAGPVHLPNAILEGIASKVRAERGQPAPPPPPQAPPPSSEDKPKEDDGSVPLMPPAVDP